MSKTTFKIDNKTYVAATSQHTINHTLPGPEWCTVMVDELDESGNKIDGFDFYLNSTTGHFVNSEESKHMLALSIVEQLKRHQPRGIVT